jgi:hypothetical protein
MMELLRTFAFKFNLRRYTAASGVLWQQGDQARADGFHNQAD